MTEAQLFDGLSPTTKESLASQNRTKPIVSANVIAMFGGFSREGKIAKPEIAPSIDINSLKAEVYKVLDTLEQRIGAVLSERKADEINAKRWILFIGIFLVLLIVASIVSQIINSEAKSGLTTLSSGLSVAGLLYLLYSPVQRMMAIANDRATLQLIPMAFRVRVIAATTNDELRSTAKELFDALQKVEKDAGPPR